MDKPAASRIAFSICIAVASVCAHAEEPDPIDSHRWSSPRFEIDTVPQWLPQRTMARSDLQRPWTATPLAGGPALDDVIGARLWWGRGKLAFGAGADWTATMAAPLEPRQPGTAPGAWRPRFALEFRAKAVTRDLRESLLRVQMSGDAALHFRPRSRGLQISYRERF